MTVSPEPSFSSSRFVGSISIASPALTHVVITFRSACHRLVDLGRAGHGEHDRVGRLPAAGVACGLSRAEPGGLGDLGGGGGVPRARLCATRQLSSGERRSVHLHAPGLRRPRGFPGCVGLLDFDLDRECGAGGRLRRLPRSVHPIDRQQPGVGGVAGCRNDMAPDGGQLSGGARRGTRAVRDHDSQDSSTPPHRDRWHAGIRARRTSH